MKLSKSLLTLLAASTLAFSTNVQADQNKTFTPLELQAQHLVDATSWVQNSPEYRALAYQAFNFAKIAFDNAKATAGKLKAVVVDLDETMIDNSAYQGSLVHYGQAYQSSTWGKWEREGKPTVIPGALEFAKYVNSHGGKMYYVSNRKAANQEYTVKTLIALGFPGVDNTTVLLKDKTSDKNPRFEQANAENPVVLYIGDNILDLPGLYKLGNLEARQSWVQKNASEFGVKYILLPNPMYGSWMSSLKDNFYGRTEAERNEIRINSIKKWNNFPTGK